MFRLLRFRILFAVVAILFAMVSVHHAMHMTEGLQGGLNDAPLAAADFRAPIANLEARLFAPAPLTMEERIQLAREFDTMRKSLDARGGTHLARFSARELGTLAGMSRGLGELGGADLDRIRANWMRVRSNTFDDASWFRFSEADPVAPAEEQAVVLDDADRATLALLATSLDRIEDAIRRGERDVERLGEPEPGAAWDADRSEAFVSSWREWGEGWQSELAGLRDWLPAAPGAEGAPALRFVHGAVLEAIEQLDAIPSDGRGRWNTPLRTDWERRFQGAAKKVRDARFWIQRAEQGLGA